MSAANGSQNFASRFPVSLLAGTIWIQAERSASSETLLQQSPYFPRPGPQSVYPPFLLPASLALEGLRSIRQLRGRLPSSPGKMAGGEAGVTLGQPHLSRQDLATLVRFRSGRMRSELRSGDDRASQEAFRWDSAGLSGAWLAPEPGAQSRAGAAAGTSAMHELGRGVWDREISK